MACILDGGKLTLSGYVGDDYWDDGFTYPQVVLALAQIEDDADLTVHINSAGGVATEGAAIHALLSNRSGTTNVVVEGIAASAASLIAMAGTKVTMALGSLMMIHDPAGMTWGTADEHSKTIECLEALATTYARVYAVKSGKSADECRDIMKAERWYTPSEAVEAGFADATSQAPSVAVAAFDYRAFAHAPKTLTALAAKKNWSFEAKPTAQSAVPPSQKEIEMTDKERADQLAAEVATLRADLAAATASADQKVKDDRERRTAIMALDDTKGREALAEHLYATGKTVDEAKATLAVAPTASADAPGTSDYETARGAGAGLKGPPAPHAEVQSGWAKAFTRTNAS